MKRFLLCGLAIGLLALGSVSSAHPINFGIADFPVACRDLLVRPPAHPTEGILPDIYSQFLKSNRVLFSDSHLDNYPAYFFPVSNEFDWFQTAMDTSPSDVLIGFGTNSAWDLAIRKDVKALIIGDVMGIPIFGQEFIIRPLWMIAKSRADFLSMLTGISLPKEIEYGTISSTFNYIQSQIKTKQLVRERKSVFASVLNRLESDPRVNPQQVTVLKAYFKILTGQPIEIRDERLLLGNLVGRFGSRDTYFELFNERYNPSKLMAEGAPFQLIHQPLFSVFASERAFQRMQNLFDAHVYYVGASFDNPSLYHAIYNWGERRGYRSYTVSITNILDVINPYPVMSALNFRHFLHSTGAILATPGHPLVVFRTLETRPPHSYEREEVIVPEPAHMLKQAL